jgi:hypothetical protein
MNMGYQMMSIASALDPTACSEVKNTFLSSKLLPEPTTGSIVSQTSEAMLTKIALAGILCLRLKSPKIDVIFWLSKLERMLKSF